MFAVIGLGNPGAAYEHNRHNVGFRVVDHLAERWGVSVRNARWNALTGKGIRDGVEVVLMKPQLFMNRSGLPVSMMLHDLNLSLEDVLVILDDAALPLGSLRLRKQGSSGGHNGLNDIIEVLDSDRIPRLRMGIGSSPTYLDLAEWVLSDFRKSEREIVETMLGRGADSVEEVINRGLDAAMAVVNTRTKEEDSEP
ncbi:MAG TPA: aminoacyl-tRNA hydrolase [Thermoanaerobaculia bacterium]|nr:aminoacyl-tRNA hydrolase [Thermoanaerobaculia bacterium]HUM31010.1 aminoacyl-tRNA hydrolase [Thermoanaerobaculia bacterium]HXK69308.1 aminoacyl-tRNA hydrolase [Thermoanaerobaculia bacterium]